MRSPVWLPIAAPAALAVLATRCMLLLARIMASDPDLDNGAKCQNNFVTLLWNASSGVCMGRGEGVVVVGREGGGQLPTANCLLVITIRSRFVWQATSFLFWSLRQYNWTQLSCIMFGHKFSYKPRGGGCLACLPPQNWSLCQLHNVHSHVCSSWPRLDNENLSCRASRGSVSDNCYQPVQVFGQRIG